MKRIILLVVTISLVGYVRAQENTLEVYLAEAEQVLKMQGQAVKAIDFENNYVWAITDSFLIQLNKVDKSIIYYSYPFTDEKGCSYKLKIDKNGVKWIAHTEQRHGNSLYESYSSSIYSFDGSQWEKVQSLGYGQVSSLYVDKNNNKWLTKGLFTNHLYKLEQDGFIQYTPENSGLLYDYVNKVVSDNDGNIWMINFGNTQEIFWAADIALIRYDYDGDKWTSYPYGEGGSYMGLYITIDSEGNPWFHSSPGVVQKFDVASNSWSEKIYTSSPNIISPLDTIEVERDSWYVKEWPTEFYYTNKDSIAVYDGSDWSFYTSSNSALQFGQVYQIATDSEGTTWIGTENGLVAFNENLPSIPVESVGIDNCPSGDLTEGDTHQLTAKVLPADASNQSIGWSSSEPSVLTVDANGLLTAVNAGTAAITLTTMDGEFTSSCEVNVKPKPEQNSNWDVYLEGLKVKSVVFENDYVWGVTDSSLFRLNKLDSSTTFYPFPYSNGQMSSIIEIDENGVIWLLLTEYIKGGSINESHFSRIYSFDGNQWEKVNLSGYGFNPSSMAIDNRNNKWITIGDTLYKITQDNIVQIIDEAPGLWNSFKVVSDKDGNIWVLNKARDMFWISLEILKYEGDNWISYFKSVDKPIDYYGTTIDRTGNLWLKGMEFMGLTMPSVFVIQKLDMESHSFSEPIREDSINSIYSNLHFSRFEAIEDENKFWGTRWVDGQYKGIAVISDSDYNIYTTSNSELPSDTVYQIAIDSNGTKWFCTANGLAAFNENGAGSSEEPEASNENGLTTATDSYSKKMIDIELFPNPANDFIILKMPIKLQSLTVDILNIQGKVMKSLTVTENQNRLNISQFPSGIYLVRIQSNENQILKKFVKQ